MKTVSGRIFYGLFVLGLTSLLMVACGDGGSGGGGSGSSAGTGTVSLSLTDNSDGYNSVVISVMEVGFVTNDSATTYYNSADFETLPVILDVLELPGASTYYMGDIEVELPASGEPLCFNQIRMVLAADPKKPEDPIDPLCVDEPFCNYVVLEGDDDTPQWLQTPSGSESGLKINTPKDFCLEEGDDTLSVVIEFDPMTAIVQQGNGGFLLKPTGIKIIEGDFSGAPESYIDGTAVVPVSKTGDVCDVYDPPPTVTVNAYNSAVVDSAPSSSTSVLLETPLLGSEVDSEVCVEWCALEADPGACEADCTAGTSPECFYTGEFKLLLADKGTYNLEATWEDFIANKDGVVYNSSVLMILE